MNMRPLGDLLDAAVPWLRFLPHAAAVLFFALWWHRGDVIAREKANSAALVAMYEAKSAEALAADLNHAADIQAKNDQIKQEKSVAIENQRMAARAAVDAYVARLRAQAGQSGGGGKNLPAAAFTPAVLDDAGEATVVPVSDLHICAENTVIAQGWQDWFKAVSTVTP